ncbi:MAG: acyltransferase [Actinomycetota bacterium]|nr:acyltransferase [Actinomycetota bacterium]
MATPVSDPPAPTRRAAVPALTGLRFFAAAWVVVFHFRNDVGALFPSWAQASWFYERGFLGVDLFFILSGFILAYNYRDRLAGSLDARSYRHFLGLRLARIYPVHLFTLAVVLLMVVTAQLAGHRLNHTLDHFTAGDFAAQLALVVAWTSHAPTLDWNYPAWSISAEWAAYLTFPLVALGLRRSRSLLAGLAGASVALAGYFLVSFWSDSALVRLAGEFVCGVFLCQIFDHSRPSRVWARVAAATVVLLVVDLRFIRGTAVLDLAVVMFAVLILALAHEGRGLAAVLSGRRVVFLGEASYALYMTHAVVEMAGSSVAPMQAWSGKPVAARVALLLAYGIVVLAVAIATYLVVERPSRIWWRRTLIRPEQDARRETGASQSARS